MTRVSRATAIPLEAASLDETKPDVFEHRTALRRPPSAGDSGAVLGLSTP